MRSFRSILFIGCILVNYALLSGRTFIVSKSGGTSYNSIQSAINAASAGDTVTISDDAIYDEQVTVDSTKNGLTIQSKNPESLTKPTVVWTDTVNVHPTSYLESQNEQTINFDQNGALRLMNVRDVTIDGVRIDGGRRYPFGYPAVWNQKDPLFHGNAALVLYSAGSAIIRNCEFENAYFGIYVRDRNDGGIFANANPADIQQGEVFTAPGFGKTGNHLFELNRIHNNSWGMFFESVWDLGSTIRYNLFYENYHDPETFATKVKSMFGGKWQPGGALFLKDVMLSPLAIYNNTFWHNYVILGGHWQAGAHHLLYNNIVAEPFSYYASNKTFPNPYEAYDCRFVYRMYNSLYACQDTVHKPRTQKYNAGMSDPGTGQYIQVEKTVVLPDRVSIMKGMDSTEVTGVKINLEIPLSTGTEVQTFVADWAIAPGAKIKPFPSGANVRWYEIKFKSYDPLSPDFLTPDWDDALVKELILDKGLEGTRDKDGTPADLGAIPKCGTAPGFYRIKPISPVVVLGTKAKITFALLSGKNKISSPSLALLHWVKNVPFQASAYGMDANPLPLVNTINIGSSFAITNGINEMEFSIPLRTPDENYGFVEMIIKGTDSNGETVMSNVGFIPYRSTYSQPETETIPYLTKSSKARSEKAVSYEIYDLEGRLVGKYQHIRFGKAYRFLNNNSLSTGTFLVKEVNLQTESVHYYRFIDFRKKHPSSR